MGTLAEKAYLSGPMTGYKDFNYPEFDRVAALIEASGAFSEVVNPAQMGEGDKPWSYYLSRDLKMLLDAQVDAIVLLPGWEKSKGVAAELYVCTKVLCTDVYLYRDTQEGAFLQPAQLSISTATTTTEEEDFAKWFEVG
jgi:hypothetical protein